MKNLSKFAVLAFAAISFTFTSCGGETSTSETTETTETTTEGTESTDGMTTDSMSTTTPDTATAVQ